eukprot:COSAG04_NODE_3304_length_2953_cov_58.831465_2_plen_86_part_00
MQRALPNPNAAPQPRTSSYRARAQGRGNEGAQALFARPSEKHSREHRIVASRSHHNANARSCPRSRYMYPRSMHRLPAQGNRRAQ